MDKFEKLAFYGNSRKDYTACGALIERHNRYMARKIFICGMVFCFALFLLSFWLKILVSFRMLYAVSSAAMLASGALLARTTTEAKDVLYLQTAVLYLFSLGLAVTEPAERGTVSVFLLPVLSALIIDRTDRIAAFNTVFVVIYIAFICVYKAPRLIRFEVFSIIVSLFISVPFNYYIQARVIRQMLSEVENKKLIVQLEIIKSALQVKAERDSLSGLLNRATFISRVKKQMETNSQGYAALCIMDLDRFKSINDSFGHQAGDRTIETVSSIITEELAPGSLAGRMGGDEFMVYLDNFEDKASLCEKIERLHKAIDAAHICDGLSVTSSIGVVLAAKEQPDFETLYSQADQALYRAKELGRDRVFIAGLEPEQSPK